MNYFISHLSPEIAIDQTDYTHKLDQLIKKNPKAVVIISAHNTSDHIIISNNTSNYELIYDFYGFDPKLHQLKFLAHSNQKIASQVKELLEAQFKTSYTSSRGLDHGAWTILYRMFKSPIEVIQVSLPLNLSLEAYYQIGQLLKPLNDDNIMIITSGVTVHSFKYLDWNNPGGLSWAKQFDDFLIESLNNPLQLIKQVQLYPHYQKATNSGEHFYPFIIFLGTSTHIEIINQGQILGSMSCLALAGW